MDIQIPSNLERYLFEAFGHDPDQIRELQSHLMATGRVELSPPIHARLKSDFTAAWRPDTDIVETIRHTYEQSGVVLDPHTAVGWSVATEHPVEVPTVVVATAHPAKFPDVVERATGQTPHLPDDVAEALAGSERITRLEPDLEALGRLLDGIAAEGQS